MVIHLTSVTIVVAPGDYCNGSEQDCSIASVSIMETLQSCTKSSVYAHNNNNNNNKQYQKQQQKLNISDALCGVKCHEISS